MGLTMSIYVYQAQYGDCFLVACHSEEKTTHILIDGGLVNTMYKVSKELCKIDKIDLMIVTHIDDDHISGCIELIRKNGYAQEPSIVKIEEAWHNSYRHLFSPINPDLKLTNEQRLRLTSIKNSVLNNKAFKNQYEGHAIGPKKGSDLGKLLLEYGYNWNTRFNGKAVVVDSEPTKCAVNDVTITLLSPDWDKLNRLKKDWHQQLKDKKLFGENTEGQYIDDAFEFLLMGIEDKVKKGHLISSQESNDMDTILGESASIKEDNATNNGSSIAFILEHKGKKILFLGDAHPSIVVDSLKKLYQDAEFPINFDAIKVSHHGSKNNILFADRNGSPCSLTDYVVSSRYIFSADGTKHNNPHRFTIAKIISSNPKEKTLYFNYKTANSRFFDNRSDLKEKHKYTVCYVENQPINI